MAITKFSTSTLRSDVSKFSSFFAGNDWAFELLQTVSVGSSGASSITFSNIPQNYRHLMIVMSARLNEAVTVNDLLMRFNGDTGTNYTGLHQLRGDGSSASSGYFFGPSASGLYPFPPPGTSMSTSNFGVAVIDLFDYSSTNKRKTMKSNSAIENSANSLGWVFTRSGAWMNSSAIQSVSLSVLNPGAGSLMVQHTVCSLYGVK